MDALEAPPRAASELSYASARSVRYAITSGKLWINLDAADVHGCQTVARPA